MNFNDQVLAGLKLKSRHNTHGARPSNAGACSRKIFYDWVGAPKAESVENLLSPLVGTALHKVLEGLFPGATSEARIEIDVGDFRIPGSADLVEDTSQGRTVTDFKFCGHKSWQRIQKKPKPDHVDQVHLYAFACEAQIGRLVYVDQLRLQGIASSQVGKGYAFRECTRELRTVEHTFLIDTDKARNAIGKFEDVYRYVQQRNPPARPFYDRENHDGSVTRAQDMFPCAWCEYSKYCWEV